MLLKHNANITSINKSNMLNEHSSDSPAGRLKMICKMEGITQKELADSVGMSLRGFATILGEKSKVSKTLALAVEARLGYRADWILIEEGSKKRNFDDEKSPIERLKLFLTDDPYGLLLRELFLRKTLEPLRHRQEKFQLESERSSDLKKIYQKKIKNYSKFRKELIQILNEVSKDHFKLIPLLVAGSFRDEWDEIKFQIDEYQFLEKQKPSEKEDLEKLIQSLWKAMNKIEKVFPYEEVEVCSTAYSLEDYGSID